MESQLIRHDEPYNIICGKNGKFGLHVATLVLVKEKKRSFDTIPMNERVFVCSYPVVSGGYGLDGQIWMDSEQKDCLLIARKEEPVSLYSLKKVMEYCGKNRVFNYKIKIPIQFNMVLFEFGSSIILPTDETGAPILDYKVELEFEAGENGISCAVYSSKDSNFYFYEYFADDDAENNQLMNRPKAIKSMANLRNNYLNVLGIKSITFTTKNKIFEDFVDELNSYKVDGEGV